MSPAACRYHRASAPGYGPSWCQSMHLTVGPSKTQSCSEQQDAIGAQIAVDFRLIVQNGISHAARRRGEIVCVHVTLQIVHKQFIHRAAEDIGRWVLAVPVGQDLGALPTVRCAEVPPYMVRNSLARPTVSVRCSSDSTVTAALTQKCIDKSLRPWIVTTSHVMPLARKRLPTPPAKRDANSPTVLRWRAKNCNSAS